MTKGGAIPLYNLAFNIRSWYSPSQAPAGSLSVKPLGREIVCGENSSSEIKNMQFSFHLIIEYTGTKGAEEERAEKQFFSGYIPHAGHEEDELLLGIFGEWLIYEYRQLSGSTFFAEYILKNPDRLSQQRLDEFTQIMQTQMYSEFQIIAVKRGVYFEIEDIATGKTYRVFDTAGSKNTNTKGLLRARIAQVNLKWYLVGANPVYLPVTYTERMKKILRKELKGKPFTIRDTAEMIMKRAASPVPIPKVPTKKELGEKRKEMKSRFEAVAKKYHATMTYDGLRKAIYHEDRANVADFWIALAKKGLTQKFIIDQCSLIEDLWNYLPHKCLNDNSPIELFAKLSNKKSRNR